MTTNMTITAILIYSFLYRRENESFFKSMFNEKWVKYTTDSPCPTSPSYSVHILLHITGEVIIEDMAAKGKQLTQNSERKIGFSGMLQNQSITINNVR